MPGQPDSIPLKSWLILMAMMVLILLINIDYTAVNIAIVKISEETGDDLNTLQWLLSGYVLAWAAFVIPAGQMADIYGKRRILLGGISLFMVSSCMCGLVHTSELLITARVLQGFGGALFVPPLYALVFECFPENKRGFAIGMLGVGAGIGLAIGPSFGGFLLKNWGWRWIFLINVPLCLLTIVTLLLNVTKDSIIKTENKIDITGSLLLGSALAIGIYALNQTEVWGLKDPMIWVLLAVSVLLAFIFAFTSKKKKNPLIPKGLFKNKPFVGTMIGFSIYAFGFSVVLVILGLFLQTVQNYNAYDTGLIFLAMTIAIGVLSPYGGKMTDIMDPRIPICGGLILVSLALGIAGFMDETTPLYIIIPVMVLIGLGMGLAFPALNATMMKTVDSSILSTASGTFIMATCASNTLGVVVSTSVLVGLGRLYLDKFVNMGNITVDSSTYDILVKLFSSAYRDIGLFKDKSQEEIKVLVEYLNESFVSSMSWIMWITALLLMIAAIMGYKMIVLKKNQKNRSQPSIAIL